MQTKNQAAPLPPTLLARHWLEGEWLNSDQGVARHSPTRRQDTVTWVPVAEPSLVSRALASAGGAARAWGTTPVRVRAAWLSALAESLRARGDALAGVMCREQGTCRRRAEEDIRAASLLLGMLRHRLETSRGELLSGGASEREVLTRRRPRGTIGLVTDAIEPVSSMASTVATALGCANTVLWMPPVEAAGTSTLLCELMLAAGLPRDALTVLHGLDAERRQSSAETLAPRGAWLDAGRQSRPDSVNPTVVLADADLSLAVQDLVSSAFDLGGQGMDCCRLAIVDRTLTTTLRDQLVRRLELLRPGDPALPTTSFGPLATDPAMQSWLEQRATAIDDGAELVLDGRRISDASSVGVPDCEGPSLFCSPRVIAHLKLGMGVLEKLSFGPTLALMEVEGAAQAFAAVEALGPGRVSAIHTRDARSMLRFRQVARSARVRVNPRPLGPEEHGERLFAAMLETVDAVTRWQVAEIDHRGHAELEESPPSSCIPEEDWSLLS